MIARHRLKDWLQGLGPPKEQGRRRELEIKGQYYFHTLLVFYIDIYSTPDNKIVLICP